MALDTAQKRMSAMNPACPWRGPLVDATESGGFSVGNRQAAAFMYSGIEAGISVVLYGEPLEWKAAGRRQHWASFDREFGWATNRRRQEWGRRI